MTPEADAVLHFSCVPVLPEQVCPPFPLFESEPEHDSPSLTARRDHLSTLTHFYVELVSTQHTDCQQR